jgi:hypothetical protein
MSRNPFGPVMYWIVLLIHAGIVGWFVHTLIGLDQPSP